MTTKKVKEKNDKINEPDAEAENGFKFDFEVILAMDEAKKRFEEIIEDKMLLDSAFFYTTITVKMLGEDFKPNGTTYIVNSNDEIKICKRD